MMRPAPDASEASTPPLLAQQIALYARVSSAQQADAGTIASQLAALRARITADGGRAVAPLEFVDDGYTGGTLRRPALERLRDAAHTGAVDRLYVLAPDRLARKYAYQVVLLEEFARAGVTVVFLDRPSDRSAAQSAEDELLRQVQGMLAEYERAKILERTRRGRRHAAQTGAVSALTAAPYGYHYVAKQPGGAPARYEIIAHEATVVRAMFRWVVHDRATIAEVCRRLSAVGACSRTGQTMWSRSTVGQMLQNPAYTGAASFGRTRLAEPRGRLRPYRGTTGVPKRPCAVRVTPRDEWIPIAVPALIAPPLFEAAQAQLQENRQRVRPRDGSPAYVLTGLVVCGTCGYSYAGYHYTSRPPRGEPDAAPSSGQRYVYYRCIGRRLTRRVGAPDCRNPVVRAHELDAAVWTEVCALLRDPGRLEREYRRRLDGTGADGESESAALRRQQEAVTRGIARLIDGYAAGLIDEDEFAPRVTHLKQRAAALAQQARELDDEQMRQTELQMLVGRLEAFATQVAGGLATAEAGVRREIIRALVRRIEVHGGAVRVVFRVAPNPVVRRPDMSNWLHCPPHLDAGMQHDASW